MTILLRHKILKLLSCMFACVLFTSNAFATNYNVTYNCGYYTGTPPTQTTATYGASFTPASTANNCGQMNGATLTGWLVSGTNDVKSAGVSFTWDYDEDKTLTAVWSCYPNIDETACVQGYKITLSISNSSCRPPIYPMEPTVLYTIPTRGAYLDQARTLLMTKTDNPIQLPHVEFILSFDTNAPQNPETDTPYNVNSVPPVNLGNYRYSCIKHQQISGGIYTGHGWDSSTCFVHNNPDNYTNTLIADLTPTNRDGYLTDAGIYEAENQYTNQSWAITGCGWSSLPYINSPSLTGYTFVNWCTDPAGTTACFKGPVPNNVQNHIYYGHWTPNKYTVTYNKGAHASSVSADYSDAFDTDTQTGGATFDSPYTPLSFASAPISNNMSADTGYVFAGWTTDSTPTFTNGTLNNQYTGDTWWKRTSALNLYAAYDCDTANGYTWNNEHTACVRPTYNVTYNQGNCIIPNGSYLETAVPAGQYNLATENTAQITPNGNPPCCHFDGWSLTDPTTSETPVELLSSPVDLTSDMTVYGVCNCETVTVIYHGCDGTTTSDYPQGMSFNVLSYVATGLSSQGYTFENKWDTSPNGDGDSYAENSVYNVKSCNGSGTITVDLYAVCTQNAPTEYHIYYHNIILSDTWTGGQPTTYTYGTGASVGKPSRTHYVFLGWCVGADNCNDYATNANGYTISSTSTGDIDLYAQWDCDTNYVWNANHTECMAAEYTVTYVANAPNGATVSGMPANNPVTVTVGTTYVLADTPTSDGYTNQGWYCTDENNNEVEQINNVGHVNNGNEITMPPSNVTCTAQWGDKPIRLLWNSNGGTPVNITSPASCIYGSQAGQPGGINGITQPTKTGFTFMGWLLTNWECDLSTINSSINGNSYTQSNTGNTEGAWTVTFSYGSLSGESRCTSSDAQTNGQPDPCPVTGSLTEIDAACNKCFCKVTGYTPTNGQMCHVSSLEWTYYGQFTGSCIQSCPNFCGLYIRSNYGNFRLKVLGLQ